MDIAHALSVLFCIQIHKTASTTLVVVCRPNLRLYLHAIDMRGRQFWGH